jgi:hypothetical protein
MVESLSGVRSNVNESMVGFYDEVSDQFLVVAKESLPGCLKQQRL